jgi:creatinine amidohydrolase/Fe(II)-dependent formamide hydrolase-like protein
MHVPGFPRMTDMAVDTVRAYLETRHAVLIPLGVTEQHGYHLPLSTDTTIAERLADRIGAAADMLVAPAVNTSFSGGGLPGTINISPAVMSLVMRDMLLSLVSQGFRTFYVLLCHAGSENMRALDDTLKLLLRSNPAFDKVMLTRMPVWDLGPSDDGYRKGFAERDWHGGWVETSIMLHLAPELVRMDRLTLDRDDLLKLQREHPDNYQCAEAIVDDPMVVRRFRQRPDIEVGIMGDPARATAEEGKRLTDMLVGDAVRRIRALESCYDGTYKTVACTPPPLVF